MKVKLTVSLRSETNWSERDLEKSSRTTTRRSFICSVAGAIVSKEGQEMNIVKEAGEKITLVATYMQEQSTLFDEDGQRWQTLSEMVHQIIFGQKNQKYKDSPSYLVCFLIFQATKGSPFPPPSLRISKRVPSWNPAIWAASPSAVLVRFSMMAVYPALPRRKKT